MEKVITLAKKLITIPSVKDQPDALKAICELCKSELKTYKHKEFESNGVPSLFFYSNDSFSEKYKVVLNAHLDVVSAKPEQFNPEIKEDRLYGRGAYDMKGAAAVMIDVFKDVAKDIAYPVGLQLVTDEEIGGFNGTKHQVNQGIKAEMVIVGEPTNFDIVNAAKGVLWLKIISKGASAHGAYPWQGQNAITPIAEIIHQINKKYPVPSEAKWATTINIATIESANKQNNKVPDDCTLILDVRCLPGEQENVLNMMQKMLPDSCSMEIILNEPSYETSSDSFLVKILHQITSKELSKEVAIRPAHGSSDLRHFPQGTAVVEFGSMGYGHHTDEEWVNIESLSHYYEILKKFLFSL